VDPFRLLAGEGCSLHENVHEGVIRARLRVMDEFGAEAIPTKTNMKDGVIVMSTGAGSVRKVTLRMLAYALGVTPRGGDSFKLTEDQLYGLIAPKHPGIRDLTEDQVVALTNSIKEGGEQKAPEAAPPVEAPAPAASARKRGPAKAPVEEPPAQEPVEEPVEEKAPVKRAAPVQRPAEAAPDRVPAQREESAVRRPPIRPAPASSRAQAAVDRPDSAAQAEKSRFEEMLQVIGTAGDARDEKIAALAKQISALTKLVESLAEKVGGIDGYLTYQYNADVSPADATKRRTDIDPWVE